MVIKCMKQADVKQQQNRLHTNPTFLLSHKMLTYPRRENAKSFYIFIVRYGLGFYLKVVPWLLKIYLHAVRGVFRYNKTASTRYTGWVECQSSAFLIALGQKSTQSALTKYLLTW